MNNEDKVVSYFINNPYATNIEVSNNTGVSKSSVQRYLKKHEDDLIPSLNCTIKEQLEDAIRRARQKGGRTTFKRYDVKQEDSGKFIGLTKVVDNSIDKEEIKIGDIRAIVIVFQNNPTFTIDQLVKEFDGRYTRDYIYRCLTDPRISDIFGSETLKRMIEQLNNNRYQILKRFGGVIDIDVCREAGLSSVELEILKFRFGDECVKSEEETCKTFGISKKTVEKLECQALEKIEMYFESRKKL